MDRLFQLSFIIQIGEWVKTPLGDGEDVTDSGDLRLDSCSFGNLPCATEQPRYDIYPFTPAVRELGRL